VDDGRTPAERLVAESLIDEAGVGRPLARSTLQRARSVESYLRGEVLPRYIRRAAEIERAVRRHLRELGEAHAELRAACEADPARFARDWRAHVEALDFGEVNELIRQHNDWYPIERDLPMDPRTGDYVLVSGRPYQREELSPAWVLARFPATLEP
jgi:hypothetical protein